jgi:hypothetical protein
MADYITFTSPALCAKCGLKRKTLGYAVTKRVTGYSTREFTVAVPLCASCRGKLLSRDRLARRVSQAALAMFILTICLSVVLISHGLFGVAFLNLVITGVVLVWQAARIRGGGPDIGVRRLVFHDGTSLIFANPAFQRAYVQLVPDIIAPRLGERQARQTGHAVRHSRRTAARPDATKIPRNRRSLPAPASSAAVAPSNGRPPLRSLLSRDLIIPVAGDVFLGIGALVFARLVLASVPPRLPVAGFVLLIVGAPLLGLGALGCAIQIIILPLFAVVWSVGWLQRLPARMSPRVRVAVPAAAVAVAGLLVLPAGPAAVRHGIAVVTVGVLPVVTVAGVGGWACLEVYRREQIRNLAHLLLAGVTAAVVLLLVNPGLPGAQGAAALLFPVTVWLSVGSWRVMNDSDRLAVRAAADIAVSLMLGTTFVLLLVWLANILHMPAAEMVLLRGAVSQASAVIDLPWWAWSGLYLLLAGASLAFAVWPHRLAKAIRWFARLRVVPTAEVTRRGLTAVHIGLLIMVLVGVAAPAVVEPGIRARLAERYAETLTDNLRARGELAEYREITREFTTNRPAHLTALADVVTQIDDISTPSVGQHDATSVDLDLAQRIGQLQVTTLTIRPPELAQAEASASRRAGFDAPPADADQEKNRLTEVDSADKQDNATRHLVDQAAELAATTVANALQLPGIGHTEVVQVIREYLSGLIEDSPLKDVFAGWFERIDSHDAPPPATEIVNPDPERLKNAAAAAATSELAKTAVTDPTVVQAFLSEPPIAAAVELTNQVRYLQQGNGPCDGCAQPGYPGDQPGQPPDEHPAEPDIGP